MRAPASLAGSGVIPLRSRMRMLDSNDLQKQAAVSEGRPLVSPDPGHATERALLKILADSGTTVLRVSR